MRNPTTILTGQAEREGLALSRAKGYILKRPKARPRLKPRRGPLGLGRRAEIIKFPPKPKVPQATMPDWLEAILK